MEHVLIDEAGSPRERLEVAMADAKQEGTLPFPMRPGERLRAGREAQGLTLNDIASRTRIPIRHLEAIEASNYAVLPSPTYAVGFARAYARAIGEDEVAVAQEVRAEQAGVTRPAEYRPYEMADPARVPPRGVAIAGAIVAVVLIIAAALWFGTSLFRGSGTPDYNPAAEQATAPAVPPSAASAPVTAATPVTLTATARVWLRVYDADDKTLFMKTMDAGEKYQVPADAKGPMINVGRPDKLQVSLGNQLLPPLGSGERAIKDIGVSAQALQARAAGAPTASPGPDATPSASASPTATRSREPREGRVRRSQRSTAPRSDATAAPLSNGIY